ncbi:10234_t:CDS:2, partial [Dentiscutata heterogama]
SGSCNSKCALETAPKFLQVLKKTLASQAKQERTQVYQLLKFFDTAFLLKDCAL